MEFNLKRVAEFIRGADTEELLDRVTVYREGMEPAALDLMEGELDRRGVTREEIAEHDAKHRERDHASGRNCYAVQLLRPAGGERKLGLAPDAGSVCSSAGRSGNIPFAFCSDFPRVFARCATHQKPPTTGPDANPPDDHGS